jgi:hypothetical protein
MNGVLFWQVDKLGLFFYTCQFISHLRAGWGAMRTTPTSAMEAFVCLPPLDLMVQGEARAWAH